MSLCSISRIVAAVEFFSVLFHDLSSEGSVFGQFFLFCSVLRVGSGYTHELAHVTFCCDDNIHTSLVLHTKNEVYVSLQVNGGE